MKNYLSGKILFQNEKIEEELIKKPTTLQQSVFFYSLLSLLANHKNGITQYQFP